MTISTAAPQTEKFNQELETLIKSSSEGLANRQKKDGHWLFELEADATIPAEYIMFMHIWTR